MTAVLLPLNANSLPDGQQNDGSVCKVKSSILRIKESIDQSNKENTKWEVSHLDELLDVQRNPRAYRRCQEMAAETGADEVLLLLLGKSTDDRERRMIWEALARLTFNHDHLQTKVVSNDTFRQCLHQDLAGGYCIFKIMAAMQALMSVSPCFAGHALLTPILPTLAKFAAGKAGPGYKPIRHLAVEVLVNITANSEVRSRVAASFTSTNLRILVENVKASDKKEDQFALAMLLVNLGSHSTEDGRGCLGSALDWVPFKDFNIFDDIAAAVDAALKKCDWPPGSNAFHSLYRLASLVCAAASAPLMQALYEAELTALVQPMVRVVKDSTDDIVTGVACLALKELARFPNNFGMICGDSALTKSLVELRDLDGIEEAGKLIAYLDEYQHKIIISGGGILWRSTQLLAHAAGQISGVRTELTRTELVEWRMPHCKLEVVRDHVRTEVKELCEEVDVSNHRCSEILNVLPKMPQEEVLKAMASWDARFTDVADAERRLSTIVDYCEGVHCYAAGYKGKATACTINKLRMVVQLLHGHKPESKLPILILLAAHGGVCNVQKEVGIDAAYAQLTRTSAEHADTTSFQACVLRLLRNKREQVVEHMAVEYCARKYNFSNTHFLVPFRNILAESVGIQQIVDQNGAHVGEDDVPVSEYMMQFWCLYSIEAIVAEIRSALNDTPRRIPYDAFISWMKENTPPEQDSYSFLSAAFDINGNVLPAAVHYALCCFGVLRSATDVLLQCKPEVLTVHQASQVWHGLNAYTALAQMWNFSVDEETCCEIVEQLYGAVHCLESQKDTSEAICNLRAVLAKFVHGKPKSLSSAQDCLIVGVLMHKNLSSPVGAFLQKEFPEVLSLLKEARMRLKQIRT